MIALLERRLASRSSVAGAPGDRQGAWTRRTRSRGLGGCAVVSAGEPGRRGGLDRARRLHQIDRVLGQWNDNEIAKMDGEEALGIAVRPHQREPPPTGASIQGIGHLTTVMAAGARGCSLLPCS